MGFFLGGVLLGGLGFANSLRAMAVALLLVLVCASVMLQVEMGRSKAKVAFTQIFAKSRAINVLSFARFFLFGARDVWFVVGLPVFLASQLGWSFASVGGFLAAWVIGYGFVQAAAPRLIGVASAGARSAQVWGLLLLLVSTALAAAIQFELHPSATILIGLTVFGFVFAVNSAVHSYLILAYTDADKVALNVGFYYMANACGRLLGTLLSGLVYFYAGLAGCLWVSALFVLGSTALTFQLPSDEALV